MGYTSVSADKWVFKAPFLTLMQSVFGRGGHHSALSLQVSSQGSIDIPPWRLFVSCFPLVPHKYPIFKVLLLLGFFFSFLEAGCGAYLCNLEQQIVGSQNGLFWRRSLKVHSAQPFAVCRDTFHWTPLLRAPSKVALNISKFRASSTTLCILFQYFTILTLVCLSFLVRVETLWFCGNFGAVPAVPG